MIIVLMGDHCLNLSCQYCIQQQLKLDISFGRNGVYFKMFIALCITHVSFLFDFTRLQTDCQNWESLCSCSATQPLNNWMILQIQSWESLRCWPLLNSRRILQTLQKPKISVPSLMSDILTPWSPCPWCRSWPWCPLWRCCPARSCSRWLSYLLSENNLAICFILPQNVTVRTQFDN